MLMTSPIVRVLSHSERPPSITASIASVRPPGGGSGGHGVGANEIPQFWQLLTGHDCGLIQVGGLRLHCCRVGLQGLGSGSKGLQGAGLNWVCELSGLPLLSEKRLETRTAVLPAR